MAKITALFIAAALLLGAVRVMAAEADTRICALTKGYECTAEEGCKEWSIQEMGLPRFVRIDLAAKTITSLDKEVERTTKIATVERLEGLVVLHGTEIRGWNIALGDESGNLSLSASGDGESFVSFGSCMKP